MALNFSFATASQIVFGNHSSEKIPGLISGMGKKIVVVTGKNRERAKQVLAKISKQSQAEFFEIVGEPSTLQIEEGVKFAREKQCELVIGLGGGSVIDSAKAIAALVPNKGELVEYLEVIGLGKPLLLPPLPCIAIPTTAGTGAEVTKNSVIKSIEKKVKVSLRSELMYPDFAVVDPVLSYSMPPELTASSGVDALTHLLEIFVSNQANPFIDILCREGLTRISQSLIRAFNNGNDEHAREDMAFASMLGGMALANVKLGAVHGFAGPMGGMFEIPHGTVCACLMPAVLEINNRAMKEHNLNRSKLDELAKILTGNQQATSDDGVIWINTLIEQLKIPSLKFFGIQPASFPELIQKAKNSSSMKGNPVELNDKQLCWILENSL